MVLVKGDGGMAKGDRARDRILSRSGRVLNTGNHVEEKPEGE